MIAQLQLTPWKRRGDIYLKSSHEEDVRLEEIQRLTTIVGRIEGSSLSNIVYNTWDSIGLAAR